jgi:lysophospholipase L1-like esterase
MKTALIIGDSHVDPSHGMPFGLDLAALLQAQGYAVVQAGVGATNARQWASSNPVCNNLGRCVDKNSLPHNPDLLVISLGTNDAANAAAGGLPVSSVPIDVQRIVGLFAPKQWLWIGPPMMGDKVQYYHNDAMARLYDAAHSANVPIFDSRPSTQAAVAAGSGDGVHLGANGADVWARSASKAASSQMSGTTMKVAIGLGVVATLLVLWRKGYV